MHDFVEKGHECILKGDADLERRGNDIPGLVTLWFLVLSFFNPVRYCSPSPAALLEKEGICFLRAQPPHLPGASPPRWQGDHSCPVHGTVPRPVCDGILPLSVTHGRLLQSLHLMQLSQGPIGSPHPTSRPAPAPCFPCPVDSGGRGTRCHNPDKPPNRWQAVCTLDLGILGFEPPCHYDLWT